MRALCHLADIPNHQSRGFTVDEKSLFIIRKDDRVFAYINSCPHLGIQLEWLPDKFLDMDGDLIQCSTHGALFTIEQGECVAGPCSGQRLAAIATTITNGEVFVGL